MNEWIIDQIRRREREEQPQLPLYDDPPPEWEREDTEKSPEPRGVIIIDL